MRRIHDDSFALIVCGCEWVCFFFWVVDVRMKVVLMRASVEKKRVFLCCSRKFESGSIICGDDV